MDHAGEGRLQAYLDGELSATERALVSGHLSACAACAEELGALEEASRQLSLSLRLLDSAAPAPTPLETALARARAERVAVVRRTLLRAAGIILVLASGGAAALPGSPVREWVQAAWDRGVALFSGAAQEPAPEAAARAVGIDAAPVNGRIRVELVDLPAGTEVHVRLVDRPVAWVEATDAVGQPVRFLRGPGRVEVSGGSAAVLRVDLPRSAADARIEVDGRLHLFKSGDELRFAEPGAGDGGQEAKFRISR